MGGTQDGTGTRDGDQMEMFKGSAVEIKTRKKPVEPRTDAQKAYVKSLFENELAFGIGPAGTGKTYLAVVCAAADLMAGNYLPAGFDRRSDGSGTIVEDNRAVDSLRGGRGTFLPVADVAASVATEDLNGDGLPDLLVGLFEMGNPFFTGEIHHVLNFTRLLAGRMGIEGDQLDALLAAVIHIVLTDGDHLGGAGYRRQQGPRRRHHAAGLRLRSIASGGESLGTEMLDWGREALGCPINEIYGQTECNLVIASGQGLFPTKPGMMGRAVPGMEVAVIDAAGNPVPDGELGEIAVKRGTPVMFLEYLNKPERTAEKFIGDWLRTCLPQASIW